MLIRCVLLWLAHLGIEIEGLPEADRYIDGVVQVMIDATQNYMPPLTAERFFNWHAALFPTGTKWGI